MRILVIQVVSILLIIGLGRPNVSGKPLSAKQDDAQREGSIAESVKVEEPVEIIASETEGSKEEARSQDDLPILPPIILLDFGNNTEDANSTTEEKSKRTVNNGLGYGLDQNSLHPRKYNYYFPAGKSGTTVSIEESISPFLPKTIIERVQPSGQGQTAQFGPERSSFSSSFAPSNAASQSQPNLRQTSKGQPVFGLRTKPQKATAAVAGSSFEAYQNFATTAKPPVGSFAIQNSGFGNNAVLSTAQSPLAFSPAESISYVTPSPVNFASPQGGSFAYANQPAPTYTGQRQNIRSNVDSPSFGPVHEASTVGPLSYDPGFVGSSPSNGPRYTVENGVRYENKVFWKYPDGRVSDVPPPTYVETYAEYPASLAQRQQQQQQLQQQPQPGKSQAVHSIYESSTTENSILSQGPVQFPTVVEQAGREPNPFVSAESLSSSLPQQQVYRLGYQNLVSQRQNANLAQRRKPTGTVANSYSFSSSSSSSFPDASSSSRPGLNDSKLGHASRYRQTTPRYKVNSPDPEYTSTEPTVNGSSSLDQFFASAGKHPSRPTTAYTPKVREYLDAILSRDNVSRKPSNFGGNDLNSYSNLRYTDLLNYNPSISEYVRNPSSILNVRPTFVQTGNSLIPVIILRVDGVSPVQTKASPNVNLKALLQQYLIQYARSIQELAQPSTYDFNTDSLPRESAHGPSKSPVLDLIRLTQEDARDAPGYAADSYIGRSSYETSNLDDPMDFLGHRYTSSLTDQRKVKNVQILDDPRFTSYKLKN